jgi:hypothetical protein
MGPGPPSRRAKRSNTANSGQKGMAALGSRSTVVSCVGSNSGIHPSERDVSLSDDTLDDENWNRRRYQREDEYLWGSDVPSSPPAAALSRGSSVGLAGETRPNTSKSSTEGPYAARTCVTITNPLDPPITGLPSVRPSDNHWMLQPPPRASIMSGKERPTNRSRSGSSASSRVELSLRRRASTRHLHKMLEDGSAPELPPLARVSSYHNNIVSGPGHDRPRTPDNRPASTVSLIGQRRRRETTIRDAREVRILSRESSITVVHSEKASTTPVSSSHGPDEARDGSHNSASLGASPKPPMPNLRIVRVRSSLPRLSTIVSSDSGNPICAHRNTPDSAENRRSEHHRSSTTQSSDSNPYMMVKHRPPLATSDASSLNVLQDLVPPKNLLNSRFVSAPLVEARIQLPPSDQEEVRTLDPAPNWTGSGFAVSREWEGTAVEPPQLLDKLRVPGRDPQMRWSVDF